jgi:hypothetical protein
LTRDGRVKISTSDSPRTRRWAISRRDGDADAMTAGRRRARHGGLHVARAGARRAADYRSDIFAFGAVLHEMTVGPACVSARLRGRDDERDPERGAAAADRRRGAGSTLDGIVRRCLEKTQPRYQSAKDIVLALGEIDRQSGTSRPQARAGATAALVDGGRARCRRGNRVLA